MSKQELNEVLAEMAVQADGATVTVYEPSEFKNTVDSADCPARILLPSTEGGEHAWTQVAKGRAEMVWVVKDLFLYRPAGEGLGWYEVAYALDTYCDSYASLLATANQDNDTGFCAYSANVQEASMLVGIHTFSQRDYYGVLVTLNIQQFVS
ncbi:MAG: hypothetical protein GF364_22730 [Candidatus Lokiarchaeota archaeon]|nr:hypothetical protein [Candidatus Lokiarchaeota archaeon]